MSTDTKPEPNLELFLDVFAQIEKHPETWDQSLYINVQCGTAYCFAGWACELSGRPLNRYGFTEDERLADEVANELLGTDGWRAGPAPLYSGGNELADLYRIVASILNLDETVLRDKVAARVADGATQ